MTVKAIIHKADEGGYWAEVPALPGCVTQGETTDDVRRNLKEAIELWLEAGDAEADQHAEGEVLELAV
jgi:predicted RNase H-like HicB family nuclease